MTQPTNHRCVLAEERALRKALAPYLDVARLRRLVADNDDLHEALLVEQPPVEVVGLLGALAAILRPEPRRQIRSPEDVAALLLVEMGLLDQEELRVICLDNKNHVQKVHTVYVGSVHTAVVRVGEVFKEALKLNSRAIIVAHNHPSSDPTPSPEDVMVTRQLIAAGELLDVLVEDHLVIGRGRWVSMREQKLGFAS